MLRPYKTFSEKVMTRNLLCGQNHDNVHTGKKNERPSQLFVFLLSVDTQLIFKPSCLWFSGQGDLSLAHQRIHQSHAGLGVDLGESQRWGGRGREEGHHHTQDLSNCSGREGGRKTNSESINAHLVSSHLITSSLSSGYLWSESRLQPSAHRHRRNGLVQRTAGMYFSFSLCKVSYFG